MVWIRLKLRLQERLFADRRVGLLLIAGVVAAVFYGSWQLWQHYRYLESTDNAYVRADISPIGPNIAGYVTEVLIADNQWVEPGQVLVRLRAEEFAAQVRQAEATVAALAAELRYSEQELGRASALTAKGTGTQQRVEGQTAANRRAAAEYARAKASLDQMRIALADTEIRSPIRGVVGNRGVQIGQYVRPGLVLMEIVPLETVWIVANFKETQLANMAPGQKAEIEIDSFPDAKLEGVVDSLSPASGAEFSLLPPQNATGNFNKIVQRIPVKITLPREHPLQGKLLPGMSVVVSVQTGKTPEQEQVAAEQK